MSTFKRKNSIELSTGSLICNNMMVDNDLDHVVTKEYNYYYQLRRPVSPFQSQDNIQYDKNNICSSSNQPTMIMDIIQETGHCYLPYRPIKRIRHSFDHKTTFNGKSKNHINYIIKEELSLSAEADTSNSCHTTMHRPWWKIAPPKKDDVSKDYERRESRDANACHHENQDTSPSCFVCRRSSKSCQKKYRSTSTETIQQNSLLSYFSKLHVDSKGSNRGTKASTEVVINKTLTKNINASVDNNCSLLEEKLITFQSCFFCDKLACEKCVHKCESCEKLYCSFCTTTRYNHGRDEQIFCLDCVSAFDRQNQNVEKEHCTDGSQNEMMID